MRWRVRSAPPRRRCSRIVIREANHDLEKEKAKRAATLKAFLGVSSEARYTSFMTHIPGPVKRAGDLSRRSRTPKSMREG